MNSQLVLHPIVPVPWPTTVTLPLGEYRASVSYAFSKFIEERQYYRVYISFRITEGEYAGTEAYKQYSLSSQHSLRYFWADIKALGVYASGPQDYPKACADVLRKLVWLRVRLTKDGSKKTVSLSSHRKAPKKASTRR